MSQGIEKERDRASVGEIDRKKRKEEESLSRRKGKRWKPHLVFRARSLYYHNRIDAREQRHAQDLGQCSKVGQQRVPV